MSRKSSKNWLQSFLSRQTSTRATPLHSDFDGSQAQKIRIDEQSIAEIIVNDPHDESSRNTPRSMTLEADRASRIEEYRLEEQQRQAADDARKLASEHRSQQIKLQLELQAKLKRLERQNQDDRSTLDSQFGIEFQEDLPSEPSPDDNSILLTARAQAKNRRDRRRQAKRRARSGMTLGQRTQHAIKYALTRLIKGVFWVLTSLLKLIGKLFQSIARALLAGITGLYRWVVPMVKRRWWTFISGSIIALALGTAGGAVWWLTKAPPAPQCDKIVAWSAESERLSCAQIAADSGNPDDILKGIALVEDWQLGHPLYNQAQGLLKHWTELLLILAREKLEKQDLDGAIAMAKKIPKNSPLYADVQQEVIGWQEARNVGQKIYDTIQLALKKQSWDDASVALAKLANVNDPTWQKRLIELRKQLEAEKLAGVALKQARDFAKNHGPEQWGSAIALTDPINRKTFVWDAAQKDIEVWRNKVFDLAIGHLMDHKTPAIALALVKTIPSNIDLSPEQRQFIHLAQASEVSSNNDNSPMLQQLGRIALGHQLIAQIPDGSRFRERAMSLLPQLETQGEDVVQLAVARSLAEFGPLPFVQGAVAQAEQVSPKRPRRVQAQTLIAQWKKESQRLEDAPLLAQAQQLSKLGGVAQFRQAADLMDRVGPGRSLYGEAQRRKGTWIAQAQTLEDQPILSQARGQASAGNLSQAIQTARRVGSGRALYAEAQRDIGGWGDQLQAISDRAIMDRAVALAAKGNLSQAIDTASGVSSSAVSGEARSSISQWSAERESIRRAQAPEPPEPRRGLDPSPSVPIEPSPPTPTIPTVPSIPVAPETAPPLPVRTESDPAPPSLVPGR